MQEIALYESWLGSMVEAALGSGGLKAVQRRMLEVRHAEGNQAVWSAAAGQPEHVRAYAARLIALEDLLLEVSGVG